MRRSVLTLMAAAACAVWAAAPASAATTWSIQATPSLPNATADLTAISCSSATSCFAVGSSADEVTTINKPLAEHWNGKTWTVQATPDPAGSLAAELTGVACPSATSCFAVGVNTASTSVDEPLIEHWNGSRWIVQSTSSPVSAANGSSLSAISCAAAANCTAVGAEVPSSGIQQTIAEHWNGKTWAFQATPDPAGAQGSQLSAVSCVSAASCTAVGVFTGPSYLVVLAEHWNGKSWAIQAAPNPNGAKPEKNSVSTLTGVSCTSATNCTAVGLSNPTAGTSEKPLVEHWNGKTWATQAAPIVAGTNIDSLNGVSCVSATACTATGFSGHTIDPEMMSTVAEQWNGKAWTMQSTPAQGGTSSDFYAVTCLSAGVCTAVGTTGGVTLAERS